MNALVALALKQRALVVVIMLMMFVAGVAGFLNLNIEAYPDPVPPLVDIVTQSTGQSAEEIERNITIPIEVQMAEIPHVKTVRTISLFGLSDVKVQFTYDFTYEQAEQWVINRLSQLPQLPNGALPQISPTSPIGEIYRYQLVGPSGYTVANLKTLQDWVLERRFKALSGAFQDVADCLLALDHDASVLESQLEAQRSAGESLEIARHQLSVGATSYLAVLTAEQTYQQAALALTQASSARYSDTVALFRAVGGGWWNRDAKLPDQQNQ